MDTQRGKALGSSTVLQIGAGNPSSFILYSESFKNILGYNDHQLSVLRFYKDIGESSGVLAGYISNKAPPWVLILIGALVSLVGYGVVWLALSQTLPIPYWMCCISLLIATNSSTWLTTAALLTNVRNFPHSRGYIIGILNSYSGLSAAVFAEIYNTILPNSSSALLLLMAVGIPILSAGVVYWVRPCTPADHAEDGKFLYIQVLSATLGVCLLTTAVLNSLFSFTAPISYAAVMVLFVIAPIVVPVMLTLCRTTSSSGEGTSQPLLEDASHDLPPENSEVTDRNVILVEGENDFTLIQAMLRVDFWLLALVYFTGYGSGVTVLNHLPQIEIVQGSNHRKILLAVFNFCNFLGRLGGGVLSEYHVRLRSIPCMLWMTLILPIMVVVYVLFASAQYGFLYVGTVLLGICYGALFSIMLTTAAELFGLKNFGVIFNVISMAKPVCSWILSTWLAPYLNDKEVEKQQGLDLITCELTKQQGHDLLTSSVACLGPRCFMLTLMVLAGICILGSISGIILTKRISRLYQRLPVA